MRGFQRGKLLVSASFAIKNPKKTQIFQRSRQRHADSCRISTYTPQGADPLQLVPKTQQQQPHRHSQPLKRNTKTKLQIKSRKNAFRATKIPEKGKN
ncbi:hypothetical protein ETH_00006280 [Eimeria tenella]|uniref:Uncharacterized protein n=1 Tax=Eimeria tenella TaxID=5802 RepID=U6KZG7_EIMTE|nr:hypothetical protein ETH_00006280 [Eimeria tenella]CDJ40895.1 hypothetical protein ETH_00006280 [Eimeria tenella]|eukprot:XP_013231645.1 hypothetical protein ETH_00006280 [Eimeria tenella]